jgi:hypothetical protein
MNRRFPSILTILLVTLLAACGPAPEPTLTSADLASTAAADAWIAVTQTQAAIPTNTATLIPPTPTFLPTFTPFPTLASVPTSGASAVGGVPTNNPCYEPPPAEPKGTLVNIKLVNHSQGLVDLNLGMENPNDQGECATYFFRLGRYDQVVVSVLAACYWGYAYITDPTSNARTATPLCLFDTKKTVPVAIGTEVIGLQ